MNLPFTLPVWMPGWLFLILAVVILLWGLAFLLVPFSVIGLKARLEALESQVESMHEDLRVMAMRASGALPPAARHLEAYEDVPFNTFKRGRPAPAEQDRAPIPTPTPSSPRAHERLTPLPPSSTRPRREPRLD